MTDANGQVPPADAGRLDLRVVLLCRKKKCGEYNMLMCCRDADHAGECCFVVDHANDYPHNRRQPTAFALVRVGCPSCGWKGRRREQEVQWWRNRETPTCPKCSFHPVLYERHNVRLTGGPLDAASTPDAGGPSSAVAG